jgi:hypothetical protein
MKTCPHALTKLLNKNIGSIYGAHGIRRGVDHSKYLLYNSLSGFLRTSIKKLISGVGNYLRADSLWLSKISPFRKIKNISDNELKVLFHNIRLLTWTVYNYKKGIELEIIKKEDKLPIDYKKDFLVYGKDKDIYNNIITKEKLYEGSQIRYIYWVKNYQK